jgi:1-acyl-sn-glycerol-3-phosphate acyltransferase
MSASSTEAVQYDHGRKVASTANVEQMDPTHGGAHPSTAMSAHSHHGRGEPIAQITQTTFSSDAPKAYDRLGGMGIVKGGEAKPEKSRLLRWLFPNGTGTFGGSPADFDPDAVRQTLARVGRLFGPSSYFPLELEGLQHLPPPPVLLVSNHSGGTTIPDVWGLIVGWYRHFGVERPIHPMAHELILSIGPTRRYFGARGVVDANREMAMRVLSEWHRDLLVMPGGDIDTWRPHRERFKVRFGGRKGYARLALDAGVPIVPVANAGAHDTLYVLTDGRGVAERLRLKHLFRSSIFPVHVSLPWGLAIGPWPHIPVPVKLRYRIGPAIDPSRFRGLGDQRSQIEALDHEVREAIQQQLDVLAETS